MILAHAGHWLANLLYLLPVVIVAGLLAWQAIKDRRSARRETDPPPPAEDAGRG